MTTISRLAKKLRLQTAQRALILNAPEGYLGLLGDLPAKLELEFEPAGQFDFAHLFVKDKAELQQLIDQLLQAIEYDGLLWISYPKGSSGVKTDLNRDILWEILLEKGIRPVMQVSIDSVWSAIRFRPAEAVGK
jgi:hypothetical protein